jgi:hypothetical protein
VDIESTGVYCDQGRCGDGTSGSSARGSSQEASDDGPSGIATCAQAGAKFGFGLLWTALVAGIGITAVIMRDSFEVVARILKLLCLVLLAYSGLGC